MTSLIDIGPLTRTASLRGKELEVSGLTAEFIVGQLAQSTELRMVMAEKKLTSEVAFALISQFPQVMAECIAEGMGVRDDKPTIDFARDKLTAGETALLLTPILECTFPQGVGSFVEGLSALAREATGARPGEPGWAPATRSPAPSKNASEPAIPQAQPGDTRPAASELSES